MVADQAVADSLVGSLALYTMILMARRPSVQLVCSGIFVSPRLKGLFERAAAREVEVSHRSAVAIELLALYLLRTGIVLSRRYSPKKKAALLGRYWRVSFCIADMISRLRAGVFATDVYLSIFGVRRLGLQGQNWMILHRERGCLLLRKLKL